MNSKLKIMFASLILLTFAMGIVSAEGITDYNAPKDFDRDPMTFTHDDFEMRMDSYSEFIDFDDKFKNRDDYKVTVNGTFAQYTNKLEDKVGVLEILEIKGDKYLVECSFDELQNSKISACQKYLEEFNDLNKFKPLKIEKTE